MSAVGKAKIQRLSSYLCMKSANKTTFWHSHPFSLSLLRQPPWTSQSSFPHASLHTAESLPLAEDTPSCTPTRPTSESLRALRFLSLLGHTYTRSPIRPFYLSDCFGSP